MLSLLYRGNMQLSDIFKNTSAVAEVVSNLCFQEYLKRLSSLPDWKKKEIEQRIYDREFAEENFLNFL